MFMDNNQLVPTDIKDHLADMVAEMEAAFMEIQMPRTAYQIKHFVVGAHDTEPQQYFQCVLELQIKDSNIRRALLHKRKIELEIEQLDIGSEIDKIEADIKRIDIIDQDRAILGAWREFQVLYEIWQQFPKKYTREELDAAQPEYWRRRLARQASQDLQALGRVQIGNQESLKQIRGSAELESISQTEKRYLSVGDRKVLIAVPTREKVIKLDCLNSLVIPSGVQVKYFNIWGRSVADAYNEAALTAINDKADFILTVEDDTFPCPDAFPKLLAMWVPKTIVGAWYPKKHEFREGTAIILKDGCRTALMDTGGIEECYTIPMGCTLIPVSIFSEMSPPYFATTDHLTQDSFFSQKARELGYKLLVDTTIKCGHLDVNTGKMYV